MVTFQELNFATFYFLLFLIIISIIIVLYGRK